MSRTHGIPKQAGHPAADDREGRRRSPARSTDADRPSSAAAVPLGGTTPLAALHETRAQLSSRPAVQRLAALQAQANAAARGPHGVDPARGTVQGYFRVDHTHLTAAPGATLPSQEIRDGVPTKTVKSAGPGGFSSVTSSYDGGTRNWNAAAAVAMPNQPAMNVSRGAELAIEATQNAAQATAFYATNNAVTASNQRLKDTASVVRLVSSGQTITVPTNPNPAAADYTPKTLHQVVADATVPANHPSTLAGGPLDAAFGTSNCDDVVKNIIGRKTQLAVAVGTGAHQRDAAVPGFEPVDQIGRFVGTHSGSQDVNALVTAAETPGPPVDAPGQDLYRQELTAHGEPHADLGLNRHAAPDVGEAFLTTSLDAGNRDERNRARFATGTTDLDDEYYAATTALATVGQHADIMQSGITAAQKTLRGVWNNHYAGVVAKDGPDTVTMENYARSKERSWLILSTFNRLYANFAEFRVWVRATTNQLKSQDGDGLRSLLLRAQTDSLNVANAISARRAELQAAVQAITQDVDNLDATMLHFRMYGPEPGQSFHEQFTGTMANPLTVTLRSSFTMTQQREIAQTNAVCGAFDLALTPRTGYADVDAQLQQLQVLAAATRQTRLNDLAACHTVEDVRKVIEKKSLNTLKNMVISFLCAEGSRLDPTPGRFSRAAALGTLQTDLAHAINGNPIGRGAVGRSGRKRTKRVLEALHTLAAATAPVAMFE